MSLSFLQKNISDILNSVVYVLEYNMKQLWMCDVTKSGNSQKRIVLEAVEWFFVCSFFSFAGFVFTIFISNFDGDLIIPILIMSILLGHFIGDLFSGLLHWVCDSFGCETTKFWGPALIGPFRRHHHNPTQICQISIAENLGASSMAGIVPLGLLYFMTEISVHSGYIAFLKFTLFFSIVFAVLSNLFHRWCLT